MKNTVIIQLAGFSVFSATFLSPTMENSTQRTSPANHKGLETARQTMLSIPEMISRTEKNVAHFLVSIQKVKTSDEDPTHLTDTTTQIPEPHLKGPIQVPSNGIIQTSQTNPKTSTPRTGEEDPAKKTTPDVLIFDTRTDTSVYFQNEKEQSTAAELSDPNPPTFYIDEAIPREMTISSSTPIISTSQEAGIDSYPEELLQRRITKLKEISAANGFSRKYALMINLGLKSGKKRFHIVDLEKEQIIESGLVAHGKGKEKFTLRKQYSNINGSSCSSLGIYKIGGSYTGSFGKSYRLTGLENSNSNALSRAIVLHAMGCIPDEEIDYPICQSEGCPSVSVSFLETIGRTISKTQKPILLWMFDPLVDNL